MSNGLYQPNKDAYPNPPVGRGPENYDENIKEPQIASVVKDLLHRTDILIERTNSLFIRLEPVQRHEPNGVTKAVNEVEVDRFQTSCPLANELRIIKEKIEGVNESIGANINLLEL